MVEVRRVDVGGGLKLHSEPLYENFLFTGDVVKLIAHQPLSDDLYAFGQGVSRYVHVRHNLL